MYINLLTNEVIADESIVSVSDNGLSYFSGSSWKFLPAGQYEKTKSSSVSLTYLAASVAGTVADGAIPPESSETEKFRYYAYYFGLNGMELSRRKFAATSAAESDRILVKPQIPITLVTDMHVGTGASIEFSIIDGIKETPIVPEGITRIEHEKRFAGLACRFPGTGFLYYKNMELQEDDNIDTDNELYTVSYTPDESAFSYLPTEEEISVKVIFRIYDEKDAVPYINNIRVRQEG